MVDGLTGRLMGWTINDQRSTIVSLMHTLSKEDNPDMGAPCAALLKRLEDVAAKDGLVLLRETTGR